MTTHCFRIVTFHVFTFQFHAPHYRRSRSRAKFTYTRAGGSLLRLFDVSGLTPGKDTLVAAAGATDSSSGQSIPRYGDAHPTVYGLYVNEIEAEPVQNSRTAARVSVRYGSPELGPAPNAVQIIISGSNKRKLVSTLPDGSPIVVKYTDPGGNMLRDQLQIPVLSPNTTLEFVRTEARSPLSLSAKFRRAVNSSAWQGAQQRRGSAGRSMRAARAIWRDMRCVMSSNTIRMGGRGWNISSIATPARFRMTCSRVRTTTRESPRCCRIRRRIFHNWDCRTHSKSRARSKRECSQRTRHVQRNTATSNDCRWAHRGANPLTACAALCIQSSSRIRDISRWLREDRSRRNCNDRYEHDARDGAILSPYRSAESQRLRQQANMVRRGMSRQRQNRLPPPYSPSAQ